MKKHEPALLFNDACFYSIAAHNGLPRDMPGLQKQERDEFSKKNAEDTEIENDAGSKRLMFDAAR